MTQIELKSALPTKKVMRVFWQVKVEAVFFHEGQEYIKLTPRQGMTDKGAYRSFSDSSRVTIEVPNSL